MSRSRGLFHVGDADPIFDFFYYESMTCVRRPLAGGLTNEAMNNGQKLFIHHLQRKICNFHHAGTLSTRENTQELTKSFGSPEIHKTYQELTGEETKTETEAGTHFHKFCDKNQIFKYRTNHIFPCRRSKAASWFVKKFLNLVRIYL